MRTIIFQEKTERLDECREFKDLILTLRRNDWVERFRLLIKGWKE